MIYQPLSWVSAGIKNEIAGTVTVDGLPPPYPLKFVIMGRDSLITHRVGFIQGGQFAPKLMNFLGEKLCLVVLDQADGHNAGRLDHVEQTVAGQFTPFAMDINASGSSGGGGPGGSEVTRVRGVVTERFQPVARQIRVYDYATNAFIGEGVSDPNTGEYEINTSPYTGEVMRLVMQDYGQAFESGKAYQVGDRVRPTAPNGFVFDCSVAGVAAEEPTWSNDGTSTVTSGAAVFSPVEFFRPIMDGPVKPVVVG